jgi:hypothetical protein
MLPLGTLQLLEQAPVGRFHAGRLALGQRRGIVTRVATPVPVDAFPPTRWSAIFAARSDDPARGPARTTAAGSAAVGGRQGGRGSRHLERQRAGYDLEPGRQGLEPLVLLPSVPRKWKR